MEIKNGKEKLTCLNRLIKSFINEMQKSFINEISEIPVSAGKIECTLVLCAYDAPKIESRISK